jgi:tRNA (adenine57-N1/adenine58-N1)-methyltransferase
MDSPKVREGDFVLIYVDGKKYLKEVKKDGNFSTSKETLLFRDIIGKPYGKYGNFLIAKPTLEEIILYGIKRRTQIVYPKDLGIIAMKLALPSANMLFEVGAGSGATTIFFSYLMREGKIYSYEKEKLFYEIAKQNIEKFGYKDVINLYNLDVLLDASNIPTGFDRAFIDVKEPWLFLDLLDRILLPSSLIGFVVPTTNQIAILLKALEIKNYVACEVLEIYQRNYKINPDRIRPFDRMVAHTTFLVFARKS